MRVQFENERHYARAGEVRNKILELKTQLSKQKAKNFSAQQQEKVT